VNEHQAGRILLVEDDLMTLSAYRHLMAAQGLSVQSAMTRAGALALIGQEVFASIVLDLMLPDGPGLVGLDVLVAVRSRRLPTRVAVTTGIGDPDDLRRVQAAGPDLLLRKPIDLEYLITWLKRPPYPGRAFTP
jgi:CheY-like chemotaxis protein